MTEYDYVVVGAGSAGCVLAARLSDDPSCRVLLIEAGGWDRDPWVKIPLGWGRILQNRLHDWGYFGEPEANVGGREVECARGRIIGGSSSINAMAYVRGNPVDFDRWAASGCDGWSFADALPYFKQQESWEHGETAYRGGKGPLAVRESRYDDPLVEAYIEAVVQAGHPRNPDYNGAEQHGVGKLQSTIMNGRRCSASVAFLHPVLKRPNLTVTTHALVHRIEFNGNRASGVTYELRGKISVARAGREVILSAGVINTPQLLMLSGIGDPDALAAHDIPVRVALPGVGRNLQDHLHAMAAYSRPDPGPFQKNLRLDRVVLSLVRAQFFGSGFATDLPSGLMAFLKTDPSLKAPDTQLLFHAGPLSAGPWMPPFRRAFDDGFSCRAVLLRPESRGHLALASRNPADPIRIHWNFMATEGDRIALRKSWKVMREIAKQPAMRGFVGKELIPGEAVRSDAEIDAHIRKVAITAHHPLGTCRMGPDSEETSVVTPDLKVRGIEGLRVVDAAVMPDMIGGNINAAVMMIAGRAADLIRGRQVLAPASGVQPQRAVA